MTMLKHVAAMAAVAEAEMGLFIDRIETKNAASCPLLPFHLWPAWERLAVRKDCLAGNLWLALGNAAPTS